MRIKISVFRFAAQLSKRAFNLFFNEFEIWLLISCVFIWYFLNIHGALSDDEVLKSVPAYDMVRGYGWYDHLEFGFLGHYILGVGQLIFGRGEFGARLLIPFFAAGTVYIVYHIGRMLGNRIAGFFSAFFLSTLNFFAKYAVAAFFDVPIAFFSTLLFYQTLLFQKTAKKWNLKGVEETENRCELIPKSLKRQCILLGVTSLCLFSVKYYTVYIILIPFFYLLILTKREGKKIFAKNSLFRYYFIALLLSFIILFFPFFVAPHPEPRDFEGPDFLLKLYHLPILGNLFFGMSYAAGSNVGHLASGHLVTVAGEIYRYPPFWTYFYWLFEIFGFIFTLIFYLFSFLAILQILKRREVENLLLIFIFIPLILLSLQTVKFQRYIFLILPLIVVFTVTYLFNFLTHLLRKEKSWKRALPFLVMIILLSLEPSSGVYKSLSEPDIHLDSGYKDAADYVELRYHQYINDWEKKGLDHKVVEPFVVVSWVAFVLEYYLPEGLNINLTRLDYGNESRVKIIQKDLSSGVIHLVVDYEKQRRYQDNPLFKYIRENCTIVKRISVPSYHGSDLLIFEPSF